MGDLRFLAGATVVEIEISTTPPSLNRVGTRGSARHFHRQKKAWQKDVEMLLLAAGTRRPLGVPVTVRAVLRFPTWRRRDEGNYRSLLEKAVGDALVNGGWIPDDTPDHFRFGRVSFENERGRARTVLIVEAME